MKEMVDNIIMPTENRIGDGDDFHINKCPGCSKVYKKMKSLKKHMTEKNHSYKAFDKKDTRNIDHKLNYTKNTLSLCYLARNFLDARKRGDGERITRLYKYMTLYFKLVGKSKYAY